jgi:hypothetical protein
VPYWVNQPPIQGQFSKENLSKSCSECEVYFGKNIYELGS